MNYYEWMDKADAWYENGGDITWIWDHRVVILLFFVAVWIWGKYGNKSR
jgi:hypothetical protein